MNSVTRRIVDWETNGKVTILERTSLNDMIGEEMVIEGMNVGVSSNYGTYLEVIDCRGKEYETYSPLALEQRMKLRELIESDHAVRAKIKANDQGEVYLANPEEE